MWFGISCPQSIAGISQLREFMYIVVFTCVCHWLETHLVLQGSRILLELFSTFIYYSVVLDVAQVVLLCDYLATVFLLQNYKHLF